MDDYYVPNFNAFSEGVLKSENGMRLKKLIQVFESAEEEKNI